MELDIKNPPRAYRCGTRQQIEIGDCGKISLEADEQLTFVTPNGAEYDLARKSWGFYATPSINGRLESFNLRTALTKNSVGRFFIMLVESDRETAFFEYLRDDEIEFVAWLDTGNLECIARLFKDQEGHDSA